MPATAPWETDDSGTASKKVAAPKLAAAPWETDEKTPTVGEDLSDPKKAAASAYKGFVGSEGPGCHQGIGTDKKPLSHQITPPSSYSALKALT